jgi:hypothetical protein
LNPWEGREAFEVNALPATGANCLGAIPQGNCTNAAALGAGH